MINNLLFTEGEEAASGKIYHFVWRNYIITLFLHFLVQNPPENRVLQASCIISYPGSVVPMHRRNSFRFWLCRWSNWNMYNLEILRQTFSFFFFWSVGLPNNWTLQPEFHNLMLNYHVQKFDSNLAFDTSHIKKTHIYCFLITRIENIWLLLHDAVGIFKTQELFKPPNGHRARKHRRFNVDARSCTYWVVFCFFSVNVYTE